MLFTRVLLALPIIAGVFASPIAKSVEVEKRDLDILTIVTDLKASIVCLSIPYFTSADN
jgi:hypothetical protein